MVRLRNRRWTRRVHILEVSGRCLDSIFFFWFVLEIPNALKGVSDKDSESLLRSSVRQWNNDREGGPSVPSKGNQKAKRR